MKCPHCGSYPTDVGPRTVTSWRAGTVTHPDAESCPDCGWWCAPARQADDPHLMARTAGFGYSTQVP